jgi:hypothetical protein
MISQLSNLRGGQLLVVLILGLMILIVVGELLEIIFKMIGKLLTAKRDLAIEQQQTRQDEVALEHDKLREGILPVQICSSAGHTCGAPYHPGDFKTDTGSRL